MSFGFINQEQMWSSFVSWFVCSSSSCLWHLSLAHRSWCFLLLCSFQRLLRLLSLGPLCDGGGSGNGVRRYPDANSEENFSVIKIICADSKTCLFGRIDVGSMFCICLECSVMSPAKLWNVFHGSQETWVTFTSFMDSRKPLIFQHVLYWLTRACTSCTNKLCSTHIRRTKIWWRRCVLSRFKADEHATIVHHLWHCCLNILWEQNAGALYNVQMIVSMTQWVRLHLWLVFSSHSSESMWMHSSKISTFIPLLEAWCLTKQDSTVPSWTYVSKRKEVMQRIWEVITHRSLLFMSFWPVLISWCCTIIFESDIRKPMTISSEFIKPLTITSGESSHGIAHSTATRCANFMERIRL